MWYLAWQSNSQNQHPCLQKHWLPAFYSGDWNDFKTMSCVFMRQVKRVMVEKHISARDNEIKQIYSHPTLHNFFFKSVLTGASEPASSFDQSQCILNLWNCFGDSQRAWRIIVIANPDIIELQSDRATPGAARAITLRPVSQWKSCIREKPQSIRCWETGKQRKIKCQYQRK